MITFTRCAFMAKQACATFSQVVQKITPPIANDFLKFFFALFAILTLGVGNAWAETAKVDFSTLYSDDTDVSSTTFSVVEGISLAFDQGIGSTAPKYYKSGTAVRLYAKGTMTVSSTIGKITKITLAYGTSDKTNTISVNCGSFSTPNWTGEADEVIFTIGGTSGHRRIKSVEVTYTPSAGGGDEPSTPTKLAAPTGLTVDAITSSGATLSWNAVDNASSYVVTIVDGGSFEQDYPVTGTTTTVSDLDSSTDYLWTVTAIGDVTNYTNSEESETGEFTTSAPAGGGGGEALSYTWDLRKASYSAASENQVTWSSTDVSMVVDKANSTTNANNYLPTTRTSSRFYKSSKLTITPEANVTITSVVFIATTEAYANALQSSTWTNATAAVSNMTVTVTPTNGATAISAIIGANCGFTGVTVNYTKAASDEPEPVIVKTLKAIEVTDMTKTFEQGDVFKFDGTCTATYSVTQNGVPQEDETAEVTPASVSTPDMNTVGTQTVFVTYSEGGVEKTAEYTITITENTVTAGTYCTGKLGYAFWGLSAEKTTAIANEVDYTRMFNDITINIKNGAKANAFFKEDHTRVYSGGYTMTFTAPVNYVITAISFTPDVENNWTGTHTANVGTMTDSKNWTGSANEVTIKFGGTCRITDICVSYEAAPVEPVKTLTGIDITNAATQTTFWQGETFNYTGLEVTAHFDGAADEVVTPTVTGSTATAGTQTVTVSYTEGTTTRTATYTITVKAIPNTKETAYSVADAYDIIDKLTTAEGVFISGIISQVDSYNSTYKSITYWISADGTTTKQLQVYSGKGLASADFSNKTDLSVGDQVIVCGNLKKFSGTYEFDKNNYLAEHTKTTKDPAGLAFVTTSYTANVGEAFTTPELTNPHNLVVTYSTSDASKATVDAKSGAVTIVAAGVVTITAATTGDASHDAGSASYTITITDPSLLIATLPFEFNGKQADIEGAAGMTHSGIDADDYKSAPYLKMNTTGDWLIICFDSEPEKLSYDIKNNSFSGGTFSVQESADGETYTDVKVHTEITETQNEEHTLLSTSRYVKFIYTNKVDGNVGLGNITISKPDTREEASLVWNPSAVTLTQGEAFTAPTLQNPKSVADITYKSSNEEVATVTAEGEIALASAIGTATITATFDGDATYKPATATCTITVNEYIETIDGEWQLVTDASKLQAGMEIIIASVADASAVKTMGEQGKNNRSAVASTVDGDKLNPAVGTTVITLEDCQLYEGLFALKTKDGYLYAASLSSNHLKSQKGINDNACWTITITEGVAAVVATYSSNHNIMRYNKTSDLFSCYASGQKDIALYAKVPEHRRTTSAGRYGTICLPGNIVKCLGATLYEVAGKDGLRVVFDEVLTPEAGMPYIFLAHNAEVLFFCGDEEEIEAGKHNSLQGTFTQIDPAADNILEGNYMLANNIIKKCGDYCGLEENRAYFVADDLENMDKAPAAAPGRRRISLDVTSENTTTGLDNITNGENTTIKVIENGQLIIIRNGEKFNAQGIKL